MSEFLPPVVAILSANITEYETGLAAAQTQMAEFVETQNVALTEMQARFATAGAAAGEELAGGVAAAAPEVTAATREIDAALADVGITAKSTAAEVQASFATMGASLEATGAKMATLSEEESATLVKLQADNAALAASTREATLANAGLGDAMAGTATKTEATNTTLGMSNKLLMGLGAAAIGTAYEAVKMGGDFQASITKLQTTAGEAKGNLDLVGQGILSMAGQVGYSSEELAKAMYTVESGGQHGSDALKTLTAAAQGAKSEQADLTTVTDAVTSALTDYHLHADQAATVTSKLVAATGAGKMTFEQLAASMSAILPVASANHVAMNDILGDLASMTMHGMSAQQASQNLADAIRHMASPTQVQSKELAALGMNATEVSKSLGAEGLSGTINEISQRITSQMGPDGMVVVNLTNALKGMSPAVQDLGKKVLDGSMTMKDFTASTKGMDVESAKQVTSFAALAGSMHGIGTEAKSGAEVYQTYAGAMQKAMGDATGLNVALMIGGENAGNTAKAIAAVSAATAAANGTVMGFDETQQNLNAKLDDAKSAFGALVTSIGLGLIPLLTPLVAGLASAAQFMAEHKTVATLLATAIGVVLVGALGALIVKFAIWAATSAAGFAADSAKGAVWVATKLMQFDAVVAKSLWAAATSVAEWAWAETVWYTTAVANGAKWLAVKTAQGVAAAASATANALTASAAWVAAEARILASALADGVTWLATWIAQGVAAAASSVIQAAVAAGAWIAANLAMIAATGGIILAVGAVIAIGIYLIKHWDDVKRIAGDVWNWIGRTVSDACDWIKNAVSSGIDWVEGLFRGLGGRLLGALGNIGSLFWNVGMDIIKGIWAGIQAGWSWLTGNVSALASNLYSAAKSALGIGSPSKVFADEVGRWIPAGIAVGIDDNAHHAISAAQTLATRLTSAMTGVEGSTNLRSNGIVTGNMLTQVAAGDSSGGGQVVNLHVNVQGHVWKTQDLVKEIQQQLLRHGIRNNSSGIDYSFG